jgi:FkbM family methyltransferase
LLKLVWVPPLNIYQHLHFRDTIRVRAGRGEQFKMVHYGHSLENELFWKGLYNGWEKYSMRLWARLAKDAEVIFDIGANTGIYSMVAKAKNTHAAVHAFEPFPAIHKKLVDNNRLNGFDIQCNCEAVSDYTGDAVIYSADKEFAYSVTVNKNLWAEEGKAFRIPIKTKKLTDYIQAQQVKRIDLMKIDVETHEPEVMEGFGDYLAKFRPIILIEILNEEVAARLSPYFEGAGVDFYNIDELKGIKKVDRLSKSDYYNFLIVPKEKAHLFNEKSLIHT